MDKLNLNTYNAVSRNSTSSNSRINIISPSDVGVLDKDAFLNMFLTQMQHQDPLNPMDSSEIATQMAQFSTLEQLSSMNTQLSSLGLISKQLSEIVNLLKPSGSSEDTSNKTENPNENKDHDTDEIDNSENKTDDELSTLTLRYDFSYGQKKSETEKKLADSINKYLVNSHYLR